METELCHQVLYIQQATYRGKNTISKFRKMTLQSNQKTQKFQNSPEILCFRKHCLRNRRKITTLSFSTPHYNQSRNQESNRAHSRRTKNQERPVCICLAQQSLHEQFIWSRQLLWHLHSCSILVGLFLEKLIRGHLVTLFCPQSESPVRKEDSSKQFNLQQGNLLLTQARASCPHQGCEEEKAPSPSSLGYLLGQKKQQVVGTSGLVTQRVVGTSGLVTQLQGNFFLAQRGTFSFPLIIPFFLLGIC